MDALLPSNPLWLKKANVLRYSDGSFFLELYAHFVEKILLSHFLKKAMSVLMVLAAPFLMFHYPFRMFDCIIPVRIFSVTTVAVALNFLRRWVEVETVSDFNSVVTTTVFIGLCYLSFNVIYMSIIYGLIYAIPSLSHTDLFIIEHIGVLGEFLFAVSVSFAMGFKSWRHDGKPLNVKGFFKGLKIDVIGNFLFCLCLQWIGSGLVFGSNYNLRSLGQYLRFALSVLILTPIQATTEEIVCRLWILQDVKKILNWFNDNAFSKPFSKGVIKHVGCVYNGVVFGFAHIGTQASKQVKSIWSYLVELSVAGFTYAEIAEDQGGIEHVSGMHTAHNQKINLVYDRSGLGALPSRFFVDDFFEYPLMAMDLACSWAAYKLCTRKEVDSDAESTSNHLARVAV